MLNFFRKFDTDALNLDELIALASFGRQLKAEYEAHSVEVPEWVDVNLKTISRVIKARTADALEKRLREVERGLAGLKTAEEKRADLRAEAEKLKAKLSAS